MKNIGGMVTTYWGDITSSKFAPMPRGSTAFCDPQFGNHCERALFKVRFHIE